MTDATSRKGTLKRTIGPHDVVWKVATYVDMKSLGRMRCVNHSFFRACNDAVFIDHCQGIASRLPPQIPSYEAYYRCVRHGVPTSRSPMIASHSTVPEGIRVKGNLFQLQSLNRQGCLPVVKIKSNHVLLMDRAEHIYLGVLGREGFGMENVMSLYGTSHVFTIPSYVLPGTMLSVETVDFPTPTEDGAYGRVSIRNMSGAMVGETIDMCDIMFPRPWHVAVAPGAPGASFAVLDG
eukprot:PhF_6_TR30584/c1_g2_i1/m.44982